MRLAMLVNHEHLTKLFLWPIFRKAFPENGGEEVLGTKRDIKVKGKNWL